MHDIRAPQALVHCRPTADRVCCAAGLTRRCGGRAQAAQRWHHRLTGASIGRTDGCLGPFMRRLTPQVVGQAGRPHCHLSGPAAHQGVNAASKGAHAHSPRATRTVPGPRAQSQARAHTPSLPRLQVRVLSEAQPRIHIIRRPTPARIRRPTHIRSHTRTSGNTKTPEPEAVPEFGGGGWGIRTPEGLHPTRFPSVRHRPLGESSVHIVPDNHKRKMSPRANSGQWSRSQA